MQRNQRAGRLGGTDRGWTKVGTAAVRALARIAAELEPRKNGPAFAPGQSGGGDAHEGRHGGAAAPRQCVGRRRAGAE